MNMRLLLSIVCIYSLTGNELLAETSIHSLISDKTQSGRYGVEIQVPENFLVFHPFDTHILVSEILTNKRAIRIMPVHKVGYGYIELKFVIMNLFHDSDEERISQYLLASSHTGQDIAEQLDKEGIFPIEIQEYSNVTRVADYDSHRMYEVAVITKKAMNFGDGIQWPVVTTTYKFIQLDSNHYLVYSEFGRNHLESSVQNKFNDIFSGMKLFNY